MRFKRVPFELLMAVALGGCGNLDPGAERAALGGAVQAGSLDTTFGAGGKAVTHRVQVNGGVTAARQSDGKIVVVTSLADGNIAGIVFGVVRFLPGGQLDAAFGDGGVVRTAFTIGFNYANAVAIAPDGKIVVVGNASTPSNTTEQFAIARYRTDGSLDPTFGNGGEVLTTLLGFRDDADAVLLQPDGKILVGGLALPCFGYRGCPTQTALVRYRGDGSLDASFGSGGKVIVQSPVGGVQELALEADGSILAANLGTVARFSAGGASEPVALSGTLATISLGGRAKFQPDGKIVVGNTAKGLGKHGIDVQMQRFTLTGAADPAFTSPPFTFGPRLFNRSSFVGGVLLEGSGKIVAVGTAPEPSSTNNFASAFGVARFNGDGSLDSSFGSGGTVTTQFDSDMSLADAVFQQPDHKLVAVGTSTFTDPSTGNLAYGLALARYLQ